MTRCCLSPPRRRAARYLLLAARYPLLATYCPLTRCLAPACSPLPTSDYLPPPTSHSRPTPYQPSTHDLTPITYHAPTPTQAAVLREEWNVVIDRCLGFVELVESFPDDDEGEVAPLPSALPLIPAPHLSPSPLPLHPSPLTPHPHPSPSPLPLHPSPSTPLCPRRSSCVTSST